MKNLQFESAHFTRHDTFLLRFFKILNLEYVKKKLDMNKPIIIRD